MTDNSPLEAYLEWLGAQAGMLQQRRSYEHLRILLGTKEFRWFVDHDDNRIADGMDVRREYLTEAGLSIDLGPVSVLEVLVGLSRRLAFMVGGESSGWAWQLVCNLDLDKFPDPIGRTKAIRVDEILEDLIYRNYQADGQGGFFPLAWPEVDQRRVEIWYQMACWVNEIHPEY